MTDWTVRDYSLHSSTVYSEVRSSDTKEVLVQFEFTEDVIRKCFSAELFSWMNIFPDVSGESSQSGAQFQGRPSEVWSQWQNQHHSQQAGEQHTHPNPSQTEVFQVRCTHTLKDCCFWTIGLKCVRTCSSCWLLTSRHSYVICLIRAVCPQLTPDLWTPLLLSLQDMLPMAGDPTQGTANYNIEDFADLGMFPPFSE